MNKTLLATFFLLPASLFGQEQSFKAYEQPLKNSDAKIQMVPIPAGQFMMGSPLSEKGRKEDEGPVHKVEISAFWMSTHEITWDVYDRFVYRDTVNSNVDAVAGPTKPYIDITFGMGKKGFPAVAMTQYNAIRFCKWLYQQSGIFYRLPTEAEWEYACKAGGKSNFDGWFETNSNGKTMPVGSKKPNGWGLYDMHGNVAEWTIDQYIPTFYEQEKKWIDPVAVPEKLYPIVLKGGSFIDDPSDCRCASRKPSDASWKRLDPQMPKSNWWFPEAPFVGLRLVRPLKTPSSQEISAYYDRKPIPDF